MTDQIEQSKGESLPDNRDKTEIAIVLETGKLFTIETPDGLISETGIRELQEYMYNQGLGTLPDDFEPVWTGKRGTLPKRVTAHCYKTSKIKLTPVQVSAIGNLVRPHASQAETYLCDFTQRFDWKAGDYGDAGSCFFGSNAGALPTLEQGGAYALRLYRLRDKDKKLADIDARKLSRIDIRGYARCWIVKLPENRLVVFNGYPDGTLNFARMLALKFSLSYRKLNVTNNGCQGGLVYINSGSYVVGQWNKIETMTNYDLGFEDIEQEPEYNCSQCGCDIGCEDDICYALNRYGESVPCCCDCSSYCEHCEESYVAGLVRELNGEYYCRDCRQAELERIADVEQEEQELEDARIAEQAKLELEASKLNANLDVVASILESEAS